MEGTVPVMQVALVLAVAAAGFFLYLSRRRAKGLREAAAMLGFSYAPRGDGSVERDFGRIPLFQQGTRRTESNVIRQVMAGSTITILDLEWERNEGDGGSETSSQTVACFQSQDLDLPFFVCRPEGALDRVLGERVHSLLGGYRDIDFEDRPGFSRKYLLYGKDESAVRALFAAPGLIDFLLELEGVTLEGNGDGVVVYRERRIVPPQDIPAFRDEAHRLFSFIAGR
ncbi:MAG: hypothetical protein JW821_12250 [Deltaproteobacteria bacterium]|nr:hypothetical protein [Deltaproteobacteria bacterium]